MVVSSLGADNVLKHDVNLLNQFNIVIKVVRGWYTSNYKE